MELSEIKSFLGDDWVLFEKTVRDYLKSDIHLLNKVNDFILTNSGKQIRPLLCILIGRACNGGKAEEQTIVYAAASELLHNATLLHDDVADRSDVRRGHPTINSLLGSTSSVLVGDYWLVKVMTSIMDTQKSESVSRVFAKTLLDLSEGEMLQLQKASSADTTKEDYLRIIFSKTASLFDALAFAGAVSVDATEEQIERMRRYSVCLGMAFQVRDDIFDYSTGMDVGKPVGVDIMERKITLPMLGAFENAGEEAASRIRKLLSEEKDLESHRDEIFDFVIKNEGISYAQSVLDDYVEKAVDALDILPESMEKRYLVELARYMGQRKI